MMSSFQTNLSLENLLNALLREDLMCDYYRILAKLMDSYSIEACDFCGCFKRVESIRVNDVVHYSCFECERMIYSNRKNEGEEENDGL